MTSIEILVRFLATVPEENASNLEDCYLNIPNLDNIGVIDRNGEVLPCHFVEFETMSILKVEEE